MAVYTFMKSVGLFPISVARRRARRRLRRRVEEPFSQAMAQRLMITRNVTDMADRSPTLANVRNHLRGQGVMPERSGGVAPVWRVGCDSSRRDR